ncbi:MAG TPA: bifunctional uroporphyrinogen-III C-methyltransferase/uroporphyrinogen-III synthase, partial [Actinobacteria bacterium]|nr:bifunctional uroporphyrinogen-III C-methyltransferase/uroporphyrinogen-III synthase [Actinomycetota bacterium]
TAVEHGLRVDVQAPEATIDALTAALSNFGAQLRDEAMAAGELGWRPSDKRAAARRKK